MIWKLIAVCFISSIILIAGFLTPITYSWGRNEISQLAAQGYQNRWIMRLGFIGFGILLVINYVVDLQNALIFWYYTLPLSIYGICISITGIFCIIINEMDLLLSYTNIKRKTTTWWILASGYILYEISVDRFWYTKKTRILG